MALFACCNIAKKQQQKMDDYLNSESKSCKKRKNIWE